MIYYGKNCKARDLQIEHNGDLPTHKPIWSRDPWWKLEYAIIQKNLLPYWKIITKVMISIFQNSTIRMISWSWTSVILVSHSKKAIRMFKFSVVDIFNSDGVSLAELDFTACFQGTCKKFDLYDFDESHKAWIHGHL